MLTSSPVFPAFVSPYAATRKESLGGTGEFHLADPQQATRQAAHVKEGRDFTVDASRFPALQISSMPATDLDPHKAADAPTGLPKREGALV